MNLAHGDIFLYEDGISKTYRRPASHHICDVLAEDIIRVGLRTYQLGSVVRYAMKYNKCPIDAVDHARALGHKLHWANQRASTVTSKRREAPKALEMKIGNLIHFEGRTFVLTKAPNNNIDLVPLAE